MPEHRPVSAAQIAAIKRPDCPDCARTRMLLSRLEAGPMGDGRRTFECCKCGRIETATVLADPMKSARGWLSGELKPPT